MACWSDRERERESREAERERGRRAASERAGKWESQAPGPRGFQHGFSGISHPQSPLILTLVAVQQLGWVGSNKFRVILRSKHGYFPCTLWLWKWSFPILILRVIIRVIIRAIIRTKIITKNAVAVCHEGCSKPIDRLADTSGKTYIFKRDSFGLYDFCLSESELHSYDRKHSWTNYQYIAMTWSVPYRLRWVSKKITFNGKVRMQMMTMIS